MRIHTLDTNFNNKLGCSAMVHIDRAPGQPIPQSIMWDKEIEIRTEDNSFPPTQWRLTDVFKCELQELTSIFTLPSHGLNAAMFWEYAKSKGWPGGLPMAVYYYEKIN